LIDFATKINSFTAQINTSNAYDLAFLIAQTTGVLRDLQDKSKEEPEHLQNAEALLNAIRDFVDSEPEQQMDETATGQKTLDVFLSEVSLMTDLDENDKDKNKEKDFNKVSLMTIHSAKGLEFPFVYIVGLEENLFPSFMSVTSRNELEEERRLFYVALTRAMKKAYMSYAEGRMRWGQYQFADPSRFIDEIDSNFIETMVNDRRKSMVFESDSVSKSSKPQYQFEAKKPKATPISTTPINSKPNFSNLKKIETVRPSNVPNSNSELIIPGIDVEHEKFGLGHVLTIEGEGNNKKAIIFFDGIGQKTLLLQYAKLIVR
jgi:DNA helicase-2/ATP-dependent DNA helicase PcrA